MTHSPTSPTQVLATVALAAILWASPAFADEIVVRNPDSCDRTTIRAAEILPETWSEVEYREKERGPTKKIPLR